MNYLFLDTSSSRVIIAVIKNNDYIFNVNLPNDNNLSNKLMVIIDENFKKYNLKPSDINKIFVVNGPGSFTGIRCGVTVAKTMAYLLNIPIATVSELEVMASGYDEKVCPIIDARRGFVYGGIYEGIDRLIDDQYILYEDLVDGFDGKIISYDYDGFEPKVDILKIISRHKDDVVDVHLLVPNYLKKTEAEENLNDKGNK